MEEKKKVIHKYTLNKFYPGAERYETQSIEMPAGAEILTAVALSGNIVIYASHEAEYLPLMVRRIYVFFTGEYMDSDKLLEYLATVIDPATAYVYHIFTDPTQ